MSQSLTKQGKYVVNSTNYKNSSLVSLYNKYVHPCKYTTPKNSKHAQIAI